MSVVGVLGASGETGRVVAELLATHSDASLVLMGRKPEPLGEIRRQLPDPARAEIRPVDAADPTALHIALTGIDVVVVTAPLMAQLATVLPTVIASGTDWIDVFLDSPSKWQVLNQLESDVIAAGRCLITGCGVHPGLAAVLIRALATKIDQPVRAEVSQLVAADWASYQVTPETMTEFGLELMDFDSSSWRQGQWRKNSIWLPKSVDFGAPFGRRSCVPMALEEIRRLPRLFPELKEAALYMAGFNPITDWLVMPLTMVMILVSKRLIDPAARWLLGSLRRYSRPPYGTVVQATVVAPDGQSSSMTVQHPDGGYWLTGAVAAATTLQYLDGTISQPGVHIEGLAADPDRLLAELHSWGARLSPRIW